MRTLFLILCAQLYPFIYVTGERAVPARTDICNRLPNFSGCPKSAGAQQPAQATTAAPAATTTAAPEDTTTAASDTTPTTKLTGTTTISPEIKKLCLQYAALAKQYCIGGPNELPVAREKCEYWRKYCKGVEEATDSPLGGPPCAPYEVQ